MVRTQVTLPKELVEEADRLLGERKRSEVIAELLERWVRLERQRAAMEAILADATPPNDDDFPPEWRTSEGAAKWVHDLRREVSPRQARIEDWIHRRGEYAEDSALTDPSKA